jgi:Co/Zn/Cd efflux system component
MEIVTYSVDRKRGLLQGTPYWSVSFELALTDRNMQVRFFLKVVLFRILRLQPVFVKCILCALCWTSCKSHSVSVVFYSFLSDFCITFHLILSLYVSNATGNNSWLDNTNSTIVFCSIFTSSWKKVAICLTIHFSEVQQKPVE